MAWDSWPGGSAQCNRLPRPGAHAPNLSTHGVSGGEKRPSRASARKLGLDSIGVHRPNGRTGRQFLGSSSEFPHAPALIAAASAMSPSRGQAVAGTASLIATPADRNRLAELPGKKGNESDCDLISNSYVPPPQVPTIIVGHSGLVIAYESHFSLQFRHQDVFERPCTRLTKAHRA